MERERGRGEGKGDGGGMEEGKGDGGGREEGKGDGGRERGGMVYITVKTCMYAINVKNVHTSIWILVLGCRLECKGPIHVNKNI